jgi:hypothetical protein
MAERQHDDLVFEARASLSTSPMATGMVLTVTLVTVVLLVAVQALLTGPLRLALAGAIILGVGAFVLIAGRALISRLPRARVHEDRVTGLLAAPSVVWFHDVTAYRREVHRYGIGTWNTEDVLWLQLADDDIRLGREWTNHRELQARILQRIAHARSGDSQ